MTRSSRALASLLTLAVLMAAGVGTALASDPATVGGELNVLNREVTVKSNGNVPAVVTMSAEAVALSETKFHLDPGESHTLTYTGTPAGTVTAHFKTVDAVTPGLEAGTATLVAKLDPKPYTPPPPWGLIGLALAALAGLVLLARKLRLTDIRLTRRSAT